MKHLGSLTISACVAAAAIAAGPARAATAPLQVPGLTAGQVPGEVGYPLDGAWQPPVLPVPVPSWAILGNELRVPLSDGATCVRGVWAVGVAVRPGSRPVLAGGTLRLRPEGSLLPRMKVERHGVAGAVRWFAGPLNATHAVDPGVSPPMQQGIAVLPAPEALTRAGRSLVVVRVSLSARVEHLAADGLPIPATPAEAQECFAPIRPQLGPQLRAILRHVTVRPRAPSPAS